MAFEGLSEKLQGALRKMTGRGRLTEQAVKEGMREVRMALLEADVNYAVAKDFIRKVTDRCVGADVLSSLTPSQQVIRIVNEEMTELMGSTNAKLNWSSSVPTIFMLCGLQGAGKTTMCAKLAGYLIKQGKKPMLRYALSAVRIARRGSVRGTFSCAMLHLVSFLQVVE